MMDSLAYQLADEKVTLDGQKLRATLCIGTFDLGPRAVFGIGIIHQDDGHTQVLLPDPAHQFVRGWRTLTALEHVPPTVDLRQVLLAVWAFMGDVAAEDVDTSASALSMLLLGRIKASKLAAIRASWPDFDTLHDMIGIAAVEAGIVPDPSEIRASGFAARLARTSLAGIVPRSATPPEAVQAAAPTPL